MPRPSSSPLWEGGRGCMIFSRQIKIQNAILGLDCPRGSKLRNFLWEHIHPDSSSPPPLLDRAYFTRHPPELQPCLNTITSSPRALVWSHYMASVLLIARVILDKAHCFLTLIIIEKLDKIHEMSFLETVVRPSLGGNGGGGIWFTAAASLLDEQCLLWDSRLGNLTFIRGWYSMVS